MASQDYKVKIDFIVSKRGQGFAQVQREMKKTEKQASKMGKGLKQALAVVGVGSFVALGAAAVKFGADSIKAFQKFEDASNEVFTLLPNLSQKATDEMRADMLRFGTEVGRTTDETIPALYQAISAGVPKENAFTFLEQAHEAALGGVASLEVAVDGITSVVNAYGEEVIDAAKASDLMFTAVRLGKTTFGELSGQLSNVTPLASALGVSFGDITAALAAMTSQGTSTAQATVQLRGLLQDISKEGTRAADVFERTAGVSFAAFIAQGNSLADALRIMEQASVDLGIPIQDLFTNIRGGLGALQLTGAGMETFVGNLAEMDTAMGATAAAAEKMGESGARQNERLGASWERLKIKIGEEGKSIANTTGGLANLFNRLSDGFDLSNIREELAETGSHIRGFGLVANEIDLAFRQGDFGVDLIGDLDAMTTAYTIANTAIQQGTIDTTEELIDFLKVSLNYVDQLEEQAKVIEEAAKADKFLSDALRERTKAIEAATDADRAHFKIAEKVTGAIIDQADAIDLAKTRGDKWQETLDSVNPALQRTERELRRTEDAWDDQQTAIDAVTKAAEEAAAIQDELNARFAESFGKAITGNLSFFNEELDSLGTQLVLVTDSSVAHQEQVSNLQAEYDAVSQTIHEYQTFARGATLTDEERAGRIKESQEQLGILGQRLADVGAIESHYVETTREATLNQQAVNQALYDSVAAAGGSAVQMAILGSELGIFTEEAAANALAIALVQEKINALAASFVAGDKSIAQIRTELDLFVKRVGELATLELEPPSVSLEVDTSKVDAKLTALETEVLDPIDIVFGSNATIIEEDEILPFRTALDAVVEEPYSATIETNSLEIIEQELTPLQKKLDDTEDLGPYEAFLKNNAAEKEREVESYLQELQKIPENITTTITTKFVTQGGPPSASPPSGLGGQHGLQLTVPPGFPNDTFGPMYASSFEEVSIKTPAQQGNGSGGDNHYHVHFDGPVYGEDAIMQRIDESFNESGIRAHARSKTI